MGRLNGIVLKHLIDVSAQQQPRWIGKTINDEDVYITYDHGTLIVKFDGKSEGFLEELNAPRDVQLTTEVMLLLTGLRVM